MAAADSVLIFVLSLLVGTIGILAGARLVLDRDASVVNAAVTALIGAVAWAITSFFVGWVPILGVLLMLIIWVGVINWRYPGGWGSAVAIGFIAWIVAVAIVYAFAVVGFVTPDALGIPGV
ncbi:MULTISPECIES: hypothetical protein [Natrinema]|uniref:Uncharacterized protein n=2 Tax=Natrinema TaxID=88723 RepID=A0A2A5QYK9_9EURY|nr:MULTISPECIES: hypothetical protein [Natrinema]MBZ6495023.1 hypothetical protein [Natrinema longum]PCR91948.1 hypothetical protein CP557_16320 [Natrinema ejinorense]QSW83682.1 hypothetical protein J0X27_09310 [Natrinema longum]